MRTSASLPRIHLHVAVAIALAASLPMARPVLAECDGPFPSFRNAAATASRIVVGRVSSGVVDSSRTDGRTSRFVLEGWFVREGDAPAREVVMDLAAQPCAGPIVARNGDVIAIAFGGRDFSPALTVNAVAWVAGVPPPIVGIETITLSEVYTLAGITPPAATFDVPPRSAEPIWLLLIVGAGAIGVLGLLMARRARAWRSGAPQA